MEKWSYSKGNMSLLVLVDGSSKEYSLLDRSLFPALDHFGMPFEILDLSKDILTTELLLSHRGIIIGQGNFGRSLSVKDVAKIEEVIKKGIGLINFDGMLSGYPGFYQKVIGVKVGKIGQTSELKIIKNNHPLTSAYDKGQRYQLEKPLEFSSIGDMPDNEVLLETLDGFPAVFTRRLGKGKIVQYTLSSKFWLPEYFGHLHGLDGLFWRSIVWVTKKPFIMFAMPPFVTARIDDCSGSGSHDMINENSAAVNFRYLDAFNKYGYIPNIGLFIDDIAPEDGKIIKEKYDRKLAEFSPHAFREDPDCYLIYMKHNGEEFGMEQLQKNFTRVDKKFFSWGIRPSQVLNAHFFETGVSASPFLREREQNFVMAPVCFGDTWIKPLPNWDPKPYGIKNKNEKYFAICDYMFKYPDFFNVTNLAPYYLPDNNHMHMDFLWGNTICRKENTRNDIEKAIQNGAGQIKIGLDSLFFGCLMTHEQRIASLTIDELEQILDGIAKLTSRYDKIFKSYDYIAKYAKSRYDTRVVESNCDIGSNKIRVKLTGKSTLPLKIYFFEDEACSYKFKEIPEFEGEKEIFL